MTDLVLGHAPRDRVVLLGAGNCNDLDLGRIAQAFTEVHLVDIDASALEDAVDRQGVRPVSTIRLHGDIDVTQLAGRPVPALESADVVVSAAILTQLISTAVQDGRRPEELLLVRDAHLHLIAGLLRAGGIGLLINDVVSSDSCRQLRVTPYEQLPALLSTLVEDRNFFTGCNPFAIAHRLGSDPGLRATKIGVSAPWRWDMGDRSYLVCAVMFRRRPGPRSHPALQFPVRSIGLPPHQPLL